MARMNHRRRAGWLRGLKARLVGAASKVSPEPEMTAKATTRDPEVNAIESSVKGPAEDPGHPRRRHLSAPDLGRPFWLAMSWAIPALAALMAFSTPFFGARAYEYLMSTGHFMVREVTVRGIDQLDQQRVLRLAGIAPGTHVLAADLDIMSKRLEGDPWIARANVSRQLPDKLIVSIHEHRPVAYLALQDLWLVNNSGQPFVRAESALAYPLPIITGLSPKAFDPAAREVMRSVARADIRAAVNLARLYDDMGLSNRWPIGEIRVEGGRRATIVISELGTEAVLGTGAYRQKLYRLEWILEKLHQEDKPADYILLDRDGGMRASYDDGRVVVAADLARSTEEIADEAHRRAKIAMERQDRGLLPSLHEQNDDDKLAPPPVSKGLKPAVGPVFLDDKERASGHALSAEREQE